MSLNYNIPRGINKMQEQKKVGFPRGKKNLNLSEIRKKMFKEGLLNVSGENK